MSIAWAIFRQVRSGRQMLRFHQKKEHSLRLKGLSKCSRFILGPIFGKK